VTDEVLAQRLQAGDTQALTTLYERYLPRIFGYFHARLRHREMAEDLTSDVFIRVLQKAGTFAADKGCFAAWIFGIARNLLIDHYRKSRPEVDLETVLEIAGDDDTTVRAEQSVQLKRARALLTQLSPEQREIVLLRLWDGLSYQEIAEALGTKENAAKVTFCRALKKLKLSDALLLLLLTTFYS
jgi:RNA polymerase sigma factor (sigma-70 family)